MRVTFLDWVDWSCSTFYNYNSNCNLSLSSTSIIYNCGATTVVFTVSLIRNPLLDIRYLPFPSKWNPYITLLNARLLDMFRESSSLNELWDKSKCNNSGCGLDIRLHMAVVHYLSPPNMLNDISSTFNTEFFTNPLNSSNPPRCVILL